MEFLAQAALSSAAIVVVVQQIWKLKIVPGKIANRYPVQVNITLSILVAAFQAPLAGISWSMQNLDDIAKVAALAAVGAAIAYNQLIEKWYGLKNLEG